MFWRYSPRRIKKVDGLPPVLSEEGAQRYDEGEDAKACGLLVRRLVEDLIWTHELYGAP